MPDTALEHEIKFLLPPRAAGALAMLLEAHFMIDPSHPDGMVTSLYYDTEELLHLRQALDGMWRKTKFRLRGYDGFAAGFAERKDRLGTRRRKRRRALGEAAPFERLRRDALPRELLLLAPPAPLFPVLLLRYRRRRFVDPTDGARLALDTDIVASEPHPSLRARRREAGLAAAVVEWKGAGRPPSRLLRLLGALGARRSSFSKYAVGYRRLAARPA